MRDDAISLISTRSIIIKSQEQDHKNTMMQSLKLALFSMLLVASGAQQYDYDQGDYGQDYGQDNLYHDYAMKQQENTHCKAQN